jgi:predicted ABC-type exoprotein transport system permease subunit
MVLTAFVIVLTMIFAQKILNYTPLLDTFSENTLIVVYTIIIIAIWAAGFTFATLLNFKDNAEYYAVKGNKKAFLMDSAVMTIIIIISVLVIPAVLSPIFDFLNQAYYTQ